MSPERSDPTVDRPYSSTWDQQARLLRVHGAVEELAVHAFRDDLEAHRTADDGLTVDLTDVDYFPSDAIGALVAAMKQATADGSAVDVLVAAGTVPQRVLTICGLPHRLV